MTLRAWARSFLVEYAYRRKTVFQRIKRHGRADMVRHVATYWLHPTKGWRRYG